MKILLFILIPFLSFSQNTDTLTHISGENYIGTILSSEIPYIKLMVNGRLKKMSMSDIVSISTSNKKVIVDVIEFNRLLTIQSIRQDNTMKYMRLYCKNQNTALVFYLLSIPVSGAIIYLNMPILAVASLTGFNTISIIYLFTSIKNMRLAADHLNDSVIELPKTIKINAY